MSVNFNTLPHLPYEIGLIKNLEILDCNYNSLIKLANAIQELPALKKLNLAGNRIESFEGFPTELPNLEVLNLTENRLRTLQGLPRTLLHLKSFFLTNNFLISLSPFPDTPELIEFEFQNNPLRTLTGLNKKQFNTIIDHIFDPVHELALLHFNFSDREFELIQTYLQSHADTNREALFHYFEPSLRELILKVRQNKILPKMRLIG